MIDPGMIKKLQADLYKRIDGMREELKDEFVEGTAGGGVVKVTANGNQELTAITILPDAVDPDDVDMLQDLVLAAVNQAMEKAKDLNESRMSEITGGLKFPGLF